MNLIKYHLKLLMKFSEMNCLLTLICGMTKQSMLPQD